MVKDLAADLPLKGSTIIMAFVSIGLVFSTMIVGVYFSGQERGVDCTEWPLCPNGLFAAPEESYVIEYVHRVLAAITAGFVYGTALIVPSRARKAKRAAIIAAVIISAQLGLGYLTATTSLHPLVVATHLSTGITAIAFTLLTFMWAGMWSKHWR
jgi:cytochrome c oxidase assembly protein subunit 15